MSTQEQNLLPEKEKLDQLTAEAIELLKQLIAIPSFSKEEDKTAHILQNYLEAKGVATIRKQNNVWALNKHFQKGKPTILLNSHHDTVKPNSGYTKDPFKAIEQDGKLYGLGSNDAGGCLVSLLATFLYFHDKPLSNYNIVFAASAEEEISGRNGIELVLSELENVEFAIVGEPTLMQLAIAEKGLMVLDCVAHGKAGHAARNEGENAIYKALKDIEWCRTFQFPNVSETLGPVKMSVTIIHGGSQHNVVPDKCEFTVDVRTTDTYSNEAALEIIKQHVTSEIKPRSVRLKPSSISKEHPIVKAGLKLGRTTYGSPTTSDQALMNFSSLKLGPGDSARSHTADEFIYINEIKEGVQLYAQMLAEVLSYK
ncbi:MAG: M20 family metallo-hydrolase [Bacteroidota bacterium]